MANYIEIPILSPLNFVDKNRVLPPNYHFKHFDAWKSDEQILPFYDAFKYKQKWQKNDIIILPAKSNFGPINVKLYNEYGDVISQANMDAIGVVGDDTYWALPFSLNLLDEGCYYLEKTVGEGDGKIELQSETFIVRESHPGTLLYKYFNSFNTEVFWENLAYIMLRVEGEIKQYDTNGIRRVYIDQPNTSQTIKGVSSRQFKLFAGNSLGIPDYLADKLQTIFDQDNVEIDGKGFSALSSGSKFNPERVDLYSFAGWSLDIAETTNRRAKRFESTGLIEKKVVIDYFAESKLFGPIDGDAENTDYFISEIE